MYYLKGDPLHMHMHTQEMPGPKDENVLMWRGGDCSICSLSEL